MSALQEESCSQKNRSFVLINNTVNFSNMVGNKSEGIITFYYNSDDLFNDVGILSAYMAKNLSSSIDDFAITDDERDIYDVCLSQALPNIYESMLKVTTGVSDAFKESADVKAQEESGLKRKVGKYVELNILDNNAYNKNVLSLVDSTIRDCIKYGVLSEYYAIGINMDLQRIVQSKFAANMLQLNQRLFQLKKRVVYSQV